MVILNIAILETCCVSMEVSQKIKNRITLETWCVRYYRLMGSHNTHSTNLPPFFLFDSITAAVKPKNSIPQTLLTLKCPRDLVLANEV